MPRIVRRIGIAVGALVIAFLALGIIAWVAGLIGLPPLDGGLFALAVLALGAVIYRDIVRREGLPAGATADEPA